jgi:hypothetical protein
MSNKLNSEALKNIHLQLEGHRPIPHSAAITEQHIVFSRVFRRKNEAADFAQHVILGEDEELIAGHATDDIGDLWWLAVRMNNDEKWRNRIGYQHNARQDPHYP